MKLCSLELLYLKSYCHKKTRFESQILKSNFVNDLEWRNLWNFVVDNFSIWIRLNLKKSDLQTM
jgi:hypothetical protein